MTTRRMYVGREKPSSASVVWVLLNAMLSEKPLWENEIEETNLYGT